MKKVISFLLVLTFIIGIAFGTGKVNAEETNSSSKESFKYAITPKSPEWKNFKTVELKDKLNIPLSEAENMDTETLLKIVLDYPFLGDIYAFDNPSNAIDFLAEQFNGLSVLLKREDLKDKLLNDHMNSSEKIMKLKDNEKIDNEERYKQKYRESLLSYPKVFNKLSQKEKDSIISNSKKVATKIDTNPITEQESATFGLVTTYAAGDVIKTGLVTTPKGSFVDVFERAEMSSDDKTSCDAYMASRYPNATKLRTATFKYNCHSYAWYSTSTSNTWWMNYPTKYMTDGSYTKVTTPASNYKVYYPNPGNEHSGIIYSVSGTTKTVTSKWGAYGLYRHSEMDCPYFSMYLCTYWKPYFM